MPQIPLISDRSTPGVLNLPSPSPQHFGAQAGQGLSEFGQALQQVGEKMQAQEDETALIQKTSAYNERLAEIPQEILDDPTIEPGQRYKQFLLKAKAHRRTLEADASPAVVRALGNHEEQALGKALIQFQRDATAVRVQAARVGVQDTQSQLAQQEAFALANDDKAGVLDARHLRTDALGRAVERGTLNPVEAQAMHERAENDKFELVAQQNPEWLMEHVEQVKAGKVSEHGMDPTKAVYYGNLAYNELHRRESLLQQQETRKEKEREGFALSTKQDYYQRFTEVDTGGHRVESTDQLLRKAGRDMVLGNHKDEVVTFLQSMLAHEKSSAGQMVDYAFYNKVILPNIYNLTYKNEGDVLRAGSDKLGPHMGTAISAFQSYRSIVTAKIAQDYEFGRSIISRAFAPLPGQQIDPMGVQETGARAADRYNTWYTSLVERAKTEGPKVFDGIDLQSEARKIKDQEHQTLQDNLIPIIEATRASLQYQSVGEIEQARKANKISVREANRALQQLETFEHMQSTAAKKPSAPSPGGRIEKK